MAGKSTFSWLHFSDLHWGTPEIKDYWSRMEKALFRDIKYLKDTYDLAYDAIFFTGDLVNRGQEYVDFNEWLSDLESELAEIKAAPVFLAVPGNHDLVRPGENDPWYDSYLVARDKWDTNEKIRNRIWKKDINSGTWTLFQSVFKNYTEWWKDTSRSLSRPPGIKDGLLPGDFSYTIEKNGYKIGIIGLNITFLHLAEGVSGKLDIHPAQLTALCSRKHDKWIDGHDICFLLTHHPVSWLSDRGKMEYSRDIAPAGRFLLHFCGHLHESSYEEMKQGFTARERRTLIGTSLFSVEKYIFKQGKNSREMKDRRHGYSAGELDFNSGSLRFWPRTVNRSGIFVVDTDLCPRGEFAESSIKQKRNEKKEQQPVDSKIAKLVQGKIKEILKTRVMEEYCSTALIILSREDKENKKAFTKADIPRELVKRGVLSGIVLIIRVWKGCCGDLENALQSYEYILSVWENLRKIIGWLVLLSVQRSWVMEQMDTLKTRYEAIRIELPVLTEAGAEIGMARLVEKNADLVKDASGLHGKSHVICDYIPESGPLIEELIKTIKLEIYKNIVEEIPLEKYTDEAEKTLNARLAVKNKIGENQYLVLKSKILKNSKNRDMVFNQLKNTLPSLNIIKLSYDTGENIFIISETVLNQYIYEFFSKKPVRGQYPGKGGM